MKINSYSTKIVKPVHLKFKTNELKNISEKLILSHWEHNYLTLLNTYNEVELQINILLKENLLSDRTICGLKQEQIYRLGELVNHHLYFENIGGDGQPNELVLRFIENSFSSFENWQYEFENLAVTLAGGSGWLILGYNSHFNILENYICNDRTYLPMYINPLLVLDIYEHAFQMDYGTDVASYVNALFTNIDWVVVKSRIEKLNLTL